MAASTAQICPTCALEAKPEECCDLRLQPVDAGLDLTEAEEHEVRAAWAALEFATKPTPAARSRAHGQGNEASAEFTYTRSAPGTKVGIPRFIDL